MNAIRRGLKSLVARAPVGFGMLRDKRINDRPNPSEGYPAWRAQVIATHSILGSRAVGFKVALIFGRLGPVPAAQTLLFVRGGDWRHFAPLLRQFPA